MPVMHIYRDNQMVTTKDFRDMFYIVREPDTGNLRWEVDEEQGMSKKGGEIHIWIYGASLEPRISFIRPDWQLSVDGVDLDQGFYPEFLVSGRTIELRYKGYSFSCQFSSPDNL